METLRAGSKRIKRKCGIIKSKLKETVAVVYSVVDDKVLL